MTKFFGSVFLVVFFLIAFAIFIPQTVLCQSEKLGIEGKCRRIQRIQSSDRDLNFLTFSLSHCPSAAFPIAAPDSSHACQPPAIDQTFL